MKRVNIITGHYGSGKTNIAINMAIEAKKHYNNVILIDLDIVNPYFRAADFTKELNDMGIKTILPVFANTNLDIPSLPSEIYGVLEDETANVIIDVGGDDSGAVALGRFNDQILAAGYDMFYVVNQKRVFTNNADDTLELMYDIENASRLKTTYIINNTHLCKETTLDIIYFSNKYTKEICKKSGIPLYANAVRSDLITNDTKIEKIMPIEIYTKELF